MSDRNILTLVSGEPKKLPSGDAAVASEIALTNNGTLKLREASVNGTNYTGLKAASSLSSDVTFTLPSADGSSGQVLQTNGSGVLSFTSPGTATVTYYQETPSGTVNGSNVTFTLSLTPASNTSVRVYKNGLLVQQAAGSGNYTISGATITFGTAPSTGQEVYAVYSTANNIRQETPSGTVNGSNVTFTLANTPGSSSSVEVYLDGLLTRQGAGSTNYTISGTTITFGTAPSTGQEVYAVYSV